MLAARLPEGRNVIPTTYSGCLPEWVPIPG